MVVKWDILIPEVEGKNMFLAPYSFWGLVAYQAWGHNAAISISTFTLLSPLYTVKSPYLSLSWTVWRHLELTWIIHNNNLLPSRPLITSIKISFPNNLTGNKYWDSCLWRGDHYFAHHTHTLEAQHINLPKLYYVYKEVLKLNLALSKWPFVT